MGRPGTRNTIGTMTTTVEASTRTEGYCTTRDGVRLYYQGVTPAGPPRATVGMLHGYNNHSGRMLGLAEYLSEHQFAAFALDYRGHGKSGGQPGHIRRFADYSRDVDAFVQHLAEQQPGPFFMLGNSLGGLILATHAMEHFHGLGAPLGIILTSPFLRLVTRLPKPAVALAYALATVWPSLTLRPRQSRGVAKGPAARPSSESLCTPRWLTETFAAQRRLFAGAGRLRTPCLMIHGGADAVADAQATLNLFDRLGGEDKTLRLYPEKRHDLMKEWHRGDVWQEIVTWCSERAPG